MKTLTCRSPLWGRMWADAGIPYSQTHEAMYQELMQRYCEPHRRYHNFRHIGQCMKLFLDAKHLARSGLAVQLALWFHDAVYETESSNNERNSAELFTEFAYKVELERATAELVARSICATTHSPSDLHYHPDTFLVVDIDIASLGKPSAEFDADTANYRKEFPHLSDEEFKKKSDGFLAGLLNKKSIYITRHFREMFEERARLNISRVLAR